MLMRTKRVLGGFQNIQQDISLVRRAICKNHLRLMAGNLDGNCKLPVQESVETSNALAILTKVSRLMTFVPRSR